MMLTTSTSASSGLQVTTVRWQKSFTGRKNSPSSAMMGYSLWFDCCCDCSLRCLVRMSGSIRRGLPLAWVCHCRTAAGACLPVQRRLGEQVGRHRCGDEEEKEDRQFVQADSFVCPRGSRRRSPKRAASPRRRGWWLWSDRAGGSGSRADGRVRSSQAERTGRRARPGSCDG
jgi:hypothetical protein